MSQQNWMTTDGDMGFVSPSRLVLDTLDATGEVRAVSFDYSKSGGKPFARYEGAEREREHIVCGVCVSVRSDEACVCESDERDGWARNLNLLCTIVCVKYACPCLTNMHDAYRPLLSRNHSFPTTHSFLCQTLQVHR